jgi:hypothetical protein
MGSPRDHYCHRLSLWAVRQTQARLRQLVIGLTELGRKIQYLALVVVSQRRPPVMAKCRRLPLDDYHVPKSDINIDFKNQPDFQ